MESEMPLIKEEIILPDFVIKEEKVDEEVDYNYSYMVTDSELKCEPDANMNVQHFTEASNTNVSSVQSVELKTTSAVPTAGVRKSPRVNKGAIYLQIPPKMLKGGTSMKAKAIQERKKNLLKKQKKELMAKANSKKKQNSKKKKHECPACGMMFNDKPTLEDHVLVNFICSCGFQLYCKDELEIHLECNHACCDACTQGDKCSKSSSESVTSKPNSDVTYDDDDDDDDDDDIEEVCVNKNEADMAHSNFETHKTSQAIEIAKELYKAAVQANQIPRMKERETGKVNNKTPEMGTKLETISLYCIHCGNVSFSRVRTNFELRLNFAMNYICYNCKSKKFRGKQGKDLSNPKI